ncbi:arginine vasopressin-induced protein 1 [Megalops cyprinoides]|uniref:arginine vasopressin-induced protein 1 n=1 Tax=Megalops cyprinoides TaxID=118141 RepID=UPI00186450B3|nr:arginine vasopressin-induced protein 1 [Megalops cyprinoides]
MEDPTPPSSTVAAAGPSQLWRSRKSGCPNIFRDVNLRQLQRLFQRAGDRDAEQRARLVWGHGNAAELAQALITLRARGRRTRLRAEGARDAPGARWLRAFGHLRINEDSAGTSDEEETVVGPEGEAGTQGNELLEEGPTDSEQLQTTPVNPLWSRPGALRQRAERNPERYLHQILH